MPEKKPTKTKPTKKKHIKKKTEQTKVTVKPKKTSVQKLFKLDTKPKPAKSRSDHELFEDLF